MEHTNGGVEDMYIYLDKLGLINLFAELLACLIDRRVGLDFARFSRTLPFDALAVENPGVSCRPFPSWWLR